MSKFVGRTMEIRFLCEAFNGRKSAFIPIYGRRRVGKTALIRESLARSDQPALYYAGRRLAGPQQLKLLLEAAATAADEPLLRAAEFARVGEALETIGEKLVHRHGRAIIVVDEFQWLAEADPGLISELQQLWDARWHHSDKHVLILCGSYIGFMEREVLGKRSPLFGRRTGSIRLGPLRSAEALELHPGLSLEDATRVYSICGGIPAYHEAFSDTRSVAQSIAAAFYPPGPLSDEPMFLLREELREVATYASILVSLAGGVDTRKGLAKAVGGSDSNMSFYLEQLIALGYVRRRFPMTGKPVATRSVRFAVSDPLLRFWFRFVEGSLAMAAIAGSARAVATIMQPQLEAYFGTCFEELCRAHLPDLYLHEGVTAAFEVGEYWDRRVQIDVVGVRGDSVIDIGECKWGTVRSLSSLCREANAKLAAFPNPLLRTLVPRVFVRRAPKNPQTGPVLLHTLEDLYAAQSH